MALIFANLSALPFIYGILTPKPSGRKTITFGYKIVVK